MNEQQGQPHEIEASEWTEEQIAQEIEASEWDALDLVVVEMEEEQ